ncbi:hypothetical protein Lepto782_09765 [Leptospira interrogans serovar Canicola]|uniref:Uncharacterized protein n=1 Tax=Leptospira interrogans serovar Canicola TaxID=211880 RepID=A0AAP9WAH7_LEPIR|nr:hypothetical protein Lepto782_09765 [Leptospira interrogans serovar Canicola]
MLIAAILFFNNSNVFIVKPEDQYFKRERFIMGLLYKIIFHFCDSRKTVTICKNLIERVTF